MQLQPITLRGRFVDMVPLTEAHAPDLLRHTARDSFTYFKHDDPEWTVEGIRKFIGECHAFPGRVPFATVLRSTGEAIGSSSYYVADLPNRGIEIGWTWIASAHRGTRVNPESKLLMMKHAFEALDCVRVQLKCDARNVRSAAAIAKLGAVREGVLRRHVIVREGHFRDSIVFSVLKEEWPHVKEGLEKRLV
ncbi:MAG: GNAT family protein [Phycisphaerales bacterium]|nr:GNAT family N-acetyltransferase [Planctomycetota bacterium]